VFELFSGTFFSADPFFPCLLTLEGDGVWGEEVLGEALAGGCLGELARAISA